MLSVIEKILLLKEIPFFQGLSLPQLHMLAGVSEETFFSAQARIFNQEDVGDALYIVVEGTVALLQAKGAGPASTARTTALPLATIAAKGYFGEMTLFDNTPHTTSAVAQQETWLLRLRREAVLALIQQTPFLAFELVKVLSQQLRAAEDRMADLARTRPRELQKFFDKFDTP